MTLSFKAERGDFDVVGRQIEIVTEVPAAAGPFTGATYSQILAGLGQSPTVLNNFADYKRSSNGDFSNNDGEEYVLQMDWTLGEGLITAIAGYSGYEFKELCDCDFTGANVFNVTSAEEFDQTSFEVRYASPTGQTVDYLVGGYYEEADLTFADTILLPSNSVLVPLLNANPAFTGSPLQGIAGTAIANTGSPRLFQQDAKSYSVFGQLTWNVTDAFRATGGLRYSKDEKDASRVFSITDINGNPLTGLQAVAAPTVYALVFNARAHSLAGNRDEDQLLPSVILEYDWSDDIMTYLSFSQGSKSGGFDARSNNPTAPPAVVCTAPSTPAGCIPAASVGSFEFEDEKADNIELGAKMALGPEPRDQRRGVLPDVQGPAGLDLRRRARLQRAQRR